MLETFTPAVCGSRKRQIVGQALFAVSAVAAAAVLGLLLGFTGSMLGAEKAVLGAAALALVAAAREAGLIRFAIPQARRQVPERWRFELPLPVWASGYGAGLGAGFFTYQPISTFWVACAGALALAEPVPAALCVSLYGAGRALMVVWPRRRADDPTAAVERLTSRRGRSAAGERGRPRRVRSPARGGTGREWRRHADRPERPRPDRRSRQRRLRDRQRQRRRSTGRRRWGAHLLGRLGAVALGAVPRLQGFGGDPGDPLGRRHRGRAHRQPERLEARRSTGRGSPSSAAPPRTTSSSCATSPPAR